MRLVADLAGVQTQQWAGYIDTWDLDDGGWGAMRVQVGCVDLARLLQEADPVFVGATSRTSGAAIRAVGQALPNPLESGDMNLDGGQQTFPLHWTFAQNPWEAIREIARSEMGGVPFIDGLGRLAYHDRAHRLGTTPSQTWGDATSIVPSRVGYRVTRDDYVTRVDVRQAVLQDGVQDAEVMRFARGATTGDSYALAAGETLRWRMQTLSAVSAVTAPVAGTDYRANSAIDGSGTDYTADVTVTATLIGAGELALSIANGAGVTVYITWLRLRGIPQNFSSSFSTVRAEKLVPGLKAGRELTVTCPFTGDDQALGLDYAVHLLRTFRHVYPRVTVAFDLDTSANAAAMLALELGDLVQFVDADAAARSTYVNDLWYVEAIEQSGQPGHMESVVVTLTPSYLSRNLDAIAYDDFARANASGDLGTAVRGGAWANDSGFDINGGQAVPNTNSLTIATLDLGVSDMVVEVDIAA